MCMVFYPTFFSAFFLTLAVLVSSYRWQPDWYEKFSDLKVLPIGQQSVQSLLQWLKYFYLRILDLSPCWKQTYPSKSFFHPCTPFCVTLSSESAHIFQRYCISISSINFCSLALCCKLILSTPVWHVNHDTSLNENFFLGGEERSQFPWLTEPKGFWGKDVPLSTKHRNCWKHGIISEWAADKILTFFRSVLNARVSTKKPQKYTSNTGMSPWCLMLK